MIHHYRTSSGITKIGGKPFFFSYVEKVVPEQEDKKPVVKDFVSKTEPRNPGEHRRQFTDELADTKINCRCW